nr:molybdopterin-dependent oxidoreductase [Sphingomonas sp. CDS-1]
MREVHTYCRNCQGNCAMTLKVENNRIASASSDKASPYSEGYFCIKGTLAAELCNGAEGRLTQCLKRGEDGVLRPIDKYQAVEEIAEKLRVILDRHGPRALGIFFGTTTYFDCVGKPMLKSFFHAIKSPNVFSTVTIDQSAKLLAPARMGAWAGGRPVYHQADVVLLAGTNPILSHQGWPLNPFPATNVARHVRRAKEKGIKLIVIDPRRTESAEAADLFIQPRANTDAAIFAALAREILANGWEDRNFLDRWAVNLHILRDAVEPFTIERVADFAGISADDLRLAARWLGEARKPALGTGTGTNFARHGNIAEHLILSIVALKGAFVRAGEVMPSPGIFKPRPDVEGVFPPRRTWEQEPKCASDPRYGKLGGEFPASILADEILHEGKDAIRALIIDGGNPVACMGEPERMAAALEHLDLLISFEPRPDSASARLAHYVIAPVLQFERNDVTSTADLMMPMPYALYAPKAIDPPEQVMGEDEFVWELARRLGVDMIFKDQPLGMDFDADPHGLPLDLDQPFDRDAIIDWIVAKSAVTMEELRANPHGISFEPTKRLKSAEEDNGARLDLCADDMAEEIKAVAADLEDVADDRFILISRRVRDFLNTTYIGTPTAKRHNEVNWLYLHPDDMGRLAVGERDGITIMGEHGEIIGYVRPDATMRQGVVAMTHCWASMEDDNALGTKGGHTSKLVSMHVDLQPINRMPLQSGIPVRLQPLGLNLEQAKAYAD